MNRGKISENWGKNQNHLHPVPGQAGVLESVDAVRGVLDRYESLRRESVPLEGGHRLLQLAVRRVRRPTPQSNGFVFQVDQGQDSV